MTTEIRYQIKVVVALGRYVREDGRYKDREEAKSTAAAVNRFLRQRQGKLYPRLEAVVEQTQIEY